VIRQRFEPGMLTADGVTTALCVQPERPCSAGAAAALQDATNSTLLQHV
jgi:hypothetical protein